MLYTDTEIGMIIRTGRVEAGLTQQELGQKLGVGKTAVAKWEAGKVKNLKREMLQQLGEIIGVSPLTLIGFKNVNDNRNIKISESEFSPDTFSEIESFLDCARKSKKHIFIKEDDVTKEQFGQIEQFISFVIAQNNNM